MRRNGFTLVEMLVVIAIIGILISMLLPALMATRGTARRLQCTANLTKIGLALDEYVAAAGVYPPGTTATSGPVENVATAPQPSWLVRLLPYVDRPAAFAAFDWEQGIQSPGNEEVRNTWLAPYVCSTDEIPDNVPPPTSYAGCHHPTEAPIDTTNLGTFFLNSQLSPDDLADGRGQTLLVGEKLWQPGDLGWASGTRATLRNTGAPIGGSQTGGAPRSEPPPAEVGSFGSRHALGANFLFADGSVTLLDRNLDLTVLQTLAHRSDGQPLSWP